jgi:hypothetical protein
LWSDEIISNATLIDIGSYALTRSSFNATTAGEIGIEI